MVSPKTSKNHSVGASAEIRRHYKITGITLEKRLSVATVKFLGNLCLMFLHFCLCLYIISTLMFFRDLCLVMPQMRQRNVCP